MANLALDRITGDTIVANFVNVYNDNNKKIENVVNDLVSNVNNLNREIKTKLNGAQVDDKISKAIADADGKSDYLTLEEVKKIINEKLKEYNENNNYDSEFEGVGGDINKINQLISNLQSQIETLQTSLTTQINNIKLDIENRLIGLEETQYIPEIDDGQLIMKKYKD